LSPPPVAPAAGVLIGGVFVLRGIYTTASSMAAELTRQDVTANNIANSSTLGFKRDSVKFESFPEVMLQSTDSTRTSLGGLAGGVQISGTVTDMEKGAARQTENPMDVFIRGEGFFVVKAPNGNAYTREGSFTLDEQNVLCTSRGHAILGVNGQIVMENGMGSIDKDGTVKSGDKVVGQLQTVTFPNLAVLMKDQNGYFLPPEGVSATPVTASLESGLVEMSNVNPVKEMVNLIMVLRSYEASSKALASQDETLSKAVNEIAK
jgi:flagellar basal-body rod protein FlgF